VDVLIVDGGGAREKRMCVCGGKERKRAEGVGQSGGGEVEWLCEQVLYGNLSTQMCCGMSYVRLYGGERGGVTANAGTELKAEDKILL